MVAQKEKVYVVHTTTRGSTADWSDIIILSGCDLCGGEKIIIKKSSSVRWSDKHGHPSFFPFSMAIIDFHVFFKFSCVTWFLKDELER